MKEDLLEIINNYGVLNQLEYYQTEVWELDNAIQEYEMFLSLYDVDYEPITINNKKAFKKHVTEELADNFVMLYQFMYFYNIELTIPFKSLNIESDISIHLKGFARQVHKLGREIIEAEFFKSLRGTYEKNQIDDIGLQLKLVVLRLKQFQAYYGITDEEIEEVMLYKIERQKERMKNESN